jgi:hypothetical protein
MIRGRKARVVVWVGAVLLMVGASSQAALVGQWTFNETSGDGLDSSGQGNSAVLVNDPVRNTDGQDRYLTLDRASSQYATVADAWANNSAVRDHMTLMAWVHPHGFYDNEPGIGKFKGGSQYWFYGFTFYTGGDVYAYLGQTNNNIHASAATDEWVHLTMTFDGTVEGNNFILYVNGVKQSEKDYLYDDVGNSTGVSFDIGLNARNNAYYDGDIDEVRIYDTALSASDVLATYEAGPVLIPEPTTLTLLALSGLCAARRRKT